MAECSRMTEMSDDFTLIAQLLSRILLAHVTFTCIMAASNRRIQWIIMTVVVVISACVLITVVTLICTRPQPQLNRQMISKGYNFTALVDSIYMNHRKEGFDNSFPTHPRNEFHNDDSDEDAMTFLSLLKPNAQLSGLDMDQFRNETYNGLTTLRNWKQSQPKQMHNGMRYEQGSIRVPASGTFFVYTHLGFHVERMSAMGQESGFDGALFKYSAASKKEHPICREHIMESTENTDDCSGWDYNINIHCTVYMDVGDQVYVKVSHISQMKLDRSWAYFGAHMI